MSKALDSLRQLFASITGPEHAAKRESRMFNCIDGMTDGRRFATKQFTKECEPSAGSKSYLNAPVLIICGGTAAEAEKSMRQYKEPLRAALEQFKGTVISGGTRAGIPGLLGEIAAELKANGRKKFKLVGYLPNAKLKHARADERYDKLFRTPDHDFSPAQPLQNWIDLLANGIKPSEVTVLGINGGPLAEFECRLALALGAKTALLRDSGRVADALLADEDLADERNLIALPDTATLAFLVPAERSEFRQSMGRKMHENYLQDQVRKRESKEPNLVPWGRLLPGLKESNCEQADAMRGILNHAGFEIRKKKNARAKRIKFSDAQVEALARLEHARWNAEPLPDGRKYGPQKDINKKISPYLVAWEDLPDRIREFDRKAVRAWPQLLAEVGLEIFRRRTGARP